MNATELLAKIAKERRMVVVVGILEAIALILLIILAALGCEEMKAAISEPNNPTVASLEDAAEGAVGLTQVLGAIWPVLIPIGTAAGGVLAAYKRLKPKIIESQKQGDKYYAAGESLAAVLEDIKMNEPELWAKIAPKIEDAAKSATEIENTIRGFRHLPPKTGSLL